MSEVNANINILVNTAQASARLRELTTQINSLNRNITSTNSAAAAQQAALNRALVDGINSSKMFNASIVPAIDSVGRFSNALEKNKLSLGEYTRYAMSQLPGMRRMFANEWQMMERVATERVKRINTQYLAMGKNTKGLQEALKIAPTALGAGLSTEMAVAAQRAQLFNKMIDDGSTKLLNWGKNTQWAGRQLMVGFSLPLAALGTIAAQTFMELDKATLALERVYGDLNTSTAEVERNSAAIQELGKEYTKYGIAVSETIGIGARAAATGAQNETLLAATEQTLRFATLGQIEYQQALDTTISLQTAFGISNDELANKINFLNAVENQTILTIEDMSLAIPRVATVVKGLGGSVEDLAVMMTALREGGVSAENGANALKSGLASLINPTDRATASLNSMGINLQQIISENRGNLMGLIKDFGTALNSIDEFSRQQVLEQVFGKYQYAKIGALFTNIASSSSQAARAMELAGRSAEDLAAISEKELDKISETTTVKFQAAMESLKVSIAPLGEAFLKGVMPIMEALTKIADAFNNLPDGVKNAIAVITGVVAGLGPVFLMTIGLIGNGIANLVKGFQFIRKTLARLRGDASAFTYLADAELDAVAAANTLEGRTHNLTNALQLQQIAVAELITLYSRLISTMVAVPGVTGGGKGGRGPAPAPLKMARGGVVPGTGNGDTVPAMLTPGETVVNKEASQKYAPVIAAMNAGTLPGYNDGLNPPLPSGKMNVAAKYGAFIQNKGTLEAIVRRFSQAEMAADGSLERLEQAMRELISEGINPTAAAVDAAVSRIKRSELQAAAAAAGAQTTIMPSGRGGGQQLQIPNERMISAGHASGQILSPTAMWQSRIQANPQAFTAAFKNEIAMAIEQGEQYVRLYNSSVYKMFQELNEKMKNGQATIDMVKEQIGNPEAQIMLRRQLEALNLSEDEIQARLIQFTAQLNAQLDAAAAQVGGGTVIPAAQMDKILRTATVKAGTSTFARGSAERAAFNQMMQPSTVLARDPNDPTKKPTRRAMFKAGQGPESYKAVDFNYGKQATQISAASLKQLKVTGEELKAMFLRLPAAAQQAAVMAGNNLSKLVPIFQQHGMLIGTGFGEVVTQSAAKASAGASVAMLKASGHGSAAPIFGAYGSQDGTLMGEEFVRATIAAILGHQMPPIPGTTPADGADDGTKYGMAYWQAAAAAVKKPLPVGTPAATGSAFAAQKAQAERMAKAGMSEQDIARQLRRQAQKAGIDQAVARPEPGAMRTGELDQKLAALRARADSDLQGLRRRRAGREAGRAADYGRVAATAGKMIGAQTIDAISKNKGTLVAASQTALKQSTPAFKGMWNAVADTFKKNVGRADLGRGNTPNFPTIQGRAPMSLGGEVSQITRGIITSLRELPTAIKGAVPAIKQAAGDIAATGKVTATQLKSAWSPIATQFAVFKTSSKQAFDSATNAIKLGGNVVSKALSETAARIKASALDFTKGKIDPTTGQRVGGRIGGIGMGAGMALSMASMIPMMAQDQNGKFAGIDAGTASMGAMIGGQLLSMIGIIPGPLLALAAAAGAAGIALKIWRNNIDDAARKAAEFGANIGGAANVIQNISEIAGKESPLQRQKKLQLSVAPDQQEQFAQFSQAFEQGAGKEFIDSLTTLTSSEKLKKVVDYIRAGIATGVFDQKEAEIFAKAVGAKIGNQLLAIQAISATKEQQTGAKATLALAQQRETEVLKNKGIQQVLTSKTPDSVNSAAAAMTISAGTQILKAYNEAIAMAEEEQKNGIITFQQYIDIVNQSKAAMQKWNDGIINARKNTDDFGATAQGAETALRLAGIGEDQRKGITDAFNAITETVSSFSKGAQMTLRDVSGKESVQLGTEASFKKMETAAVSAGFGSGMQGVSAFGKTKEGFTLAQQLAKESVAIKEFMKNDTLKNAMETAIANGMSSETALGLAKQILENPLGEAAAAFKQGGLDAQAFADALTAANAEIDLAAEGIPKSLQKIYQNIANGFATEGYKESFRAFVAAAPNKQFAISQIQGIGKGMTSIGQQEARSAFLNTGDILRGKVSDTVINQLRQSAGYKQALTATKNPISVTETKGGKILRDSIAQFDPTKAEAINKAMEEAAKSGVKEKIFTTVFAEKDAQGNPIDIVKRLNEVKGATEQLDQLPKDVLVSLKIDTGDIKDLDRFGSMAQDIANLIPVLDTLPDTAREIAVHTIFTENGDIKDPITFAKDWKIISKSLEGLKSSKKNVKKAAIIELMQQVQNEEGKTIDAATAENAYKELVGVFGEETIMKLPPSYLTKILVLQVQIADIQNQINGLDKLDQYTKSLDAGKYAQAKEKLISAQNALIGQQAGFVAAGISQGTDNGAGGGGGGASNPLVDLNKSLVEQLQMYSDMELTLKDINKKKMSIADIVLKGEGIFDKLANIKGVTSTVMERIMGMGSEGAKKWLNKYAPKGKITPQGKDQLNKIIGGLFAEAQGQQRLVNIRTEEQLAGLNVLRNKGMSQELIDFSSQNGGLERIGVLQQKISETKKGTEARKNAIKALNEEIRLQKISLQLEKDKTSAMEDPQQQMLNALNDRRSAIEADIAAKTAEFTAQSNADYQAQYGESKTQTELRIQANEKQIRVYQDQIDAKQKLNDLDQHEIDLLQHKKKIEQDNIDKLQQQIDDKQKLIDGYQHENELRNQQADVINHSLDIMSQKEDDIRKAYEDRIKALDTVASINDYIIGQQKNQLNLAQALSTGDVYAAAQAQQEIQAANIQYSTDQVRQGLQTGMENQIAGLTTESGLTRVQAEQQLAALKEQNYQNDLLITGLNNEIYNIQQAMIPYKEIIAGYDKNIADYSEQIWQRNQLIYDTQVKSIDPLTQANTQLSRQLSDSQELLDKNIKLYALKYEGELASIDMTITGTEAAIAQGKAIEGLAMQWQNVAKQVDQVNRLMRDAQATYKEVAMNPLSTPEELANARIAYENAKSSYTKAMQDLKDQAAALKESTKNTNTGNFYGGIKTSARGGMVAGIGSRDSIPMMLMPGEYVMRKASVKKYGATMFEKMNMGAFTLPQYDMGQNKQISLSAPTNVANVVSPVYNTYSINVPVTQPNASADEIANRVIMKIRNIENSSIRSINGY